MEDLRKIKEREHANKLKLSLEGAGDEEKVFSNKKFYSVTRASRAQMEKLLVGSIFPGSQLLDYCCGTGEVSIFLAKNNANVTGIDISDISIAIAQDHAAKECKGNLPKFKVMDGENLQFSDNIFDAIVCSGVLHHLDLNKVYPELSRVLKPGGRIICNEPLAYNPVFQIYRKLTPRLRTEWEAKHILNKGSINLARKYFSKVDIKFYHLATLVAVPFRHTPVFKPILGFFEAVDAVLLRIPGIKWLAWQMIFVLSDPKK
ncbi:MAG: class I SAM-dependent methyltransferase [Minisyncoccales bacterium]